MRSRRYSLDQAREFLDSAYDTGVVDGRAEGYTQAIADFGLEKACPLTTPHEAHIWCGRSRRYWCLGQDPVDIQF